jgi:(5-formylfuran-3-yl)methyl phosphate synthase
LLVSVRSPFEAQAAVVGGADIIDVKEPLSGSLGRADASVWQAVRASVPHSTPVSVALGELDEWLGPRRTEIPDSAWAGISYCKLGLAGAPADWLNRWEMVRHDLTHRGMKSPEWVAVVYLDWRAARAPHPDAIIRATIEIPECRVVLFDSWCKSAGTRLDGSWKPFIERVQKSGRNVALAGSLDLAAIKRLTAWKPEIFAIRGAACALGNRLGPIDTARVERLAEAARSGVEPGMEPAGAFPAQISKRTP